MPAPYCYDYPRPQVTVDLVVYTFRERSLRVLLIRRGREPFAGKWAIPGGFLEMDEPVEDAARRELREETGLDLPGPIAPIGFFARPGRDSRGRTITLAHAAVIRAGEAQVRGGDDAAEAAWLPVEEPLELAFDHEEILSAAREWLRQNITRGSLGLEILPTSFVAEDVHALFGGLGLPRSRALGWLRRMKDRGEIAFVDRPEPHFQVARPDR
jgi:8-oxo-dGTP diphosphatase